MSKTLAADLLRLHSQTLQISLSETPYTSPEATPHVSIKSALQSLLEPPITIQDFTLCCAALASASTSTSQHLSWVPESLSVSAVAAFREFAEAYFDDGSMHAKCSTKCHDLDLDLSGCVLEREKRLVVELMPKVLPLVKGSIKESAIDTSDENDAVSAASAGVPVAYAMLAAYQLRWLVTQVDAPYLGKLCPLVIPCALTALDHWSPEVKSQGMITFIHLARRVSASEIGGYADVILDACRENIASDDTIWNNVVEMSVLLVTLTQHSNPRSSWNEKLLVEMLNHLERQPRNKERRTAWLKHIDPLLNCLGLILVAHFSRIFPLFFKWMHADDDETVLLVLKQIMSVLRLTWIRNSPFIDRLVDELVTLYKDATFKIAREDIRALIHQILTLTRQSRKSQFKAIWLKYENDPNLRPLQPLSTEKDLAMVA